MAKRSKYHNVKTEVDGIRFDSKGEAARYKELKLLEKAGAISNLRRQVKYELIPAQWGVKDGKKVCLERGVNYYADFVYLDKDGYTVIEDVKGQRLPEYIIKRKLMLQIYDIEIKEIDV